MAKVLADNVKELQGFNPQKLFCFFVSFGQSLESIVASRPFNDKSKMTREEAKDFRARHDATMARDEEERRRK